MSFGTDEGGELRIEMHSEKERMDALPKLTLRLQEINDLCANTDETVAFTKPFSVHEERFFRTGSEVYVSATKQAVDPKFMRKL